MDLMLDENDITFRRLRKRFLNWSVKEARNLRKRFLKDMISIFMMLESSNRINLVYSRIYADFEVSFI